MPATEELSRESPVSTRVGSLRGTKGGPAVAAAAAVVAVRKGV